MLSHHFSANWRTKTIVSLADQYKSFCALIQKSLNVGHPAHAAPMEVFVHPAHAAPMEVFGHPAHAAPMEVFGHPAHAAPMEVFGLTCT